jgi:hypothetical protein
MIFFAADAAGALCERTGIRPEERMSDQAVEA